MNNPTTIRDRHMVNLPAETGTLLEVVANKVKRLRDKQTPYTDVIHEALLAYSRILDADLKRKTTE